MVKHRTKLPWSNRYVFTALICLRVYLAHLQKFSSSHSSNLLYFPNACLSYIEQVWDKNKKDPQVHMPQMKNLRQKILVKGEEGKRSYSNVARGKNGIYKPFQT